MNIGGALYLFIPSVSVFLLLDDNDDGMANE